MSEHKQLWDGVKLPSWDAERCFELFQKVSGGTATKLDQDDYLKLLMVFIAANFGRNKWVASLKRKGLDPEEVAADLLLFLHQKTAQGRFRLRVPITQVLLQAFNTAISNFLVSVVRKGADVPRITAASQCGDDDEGHSVLEVAGREEVSIRRFAAFLKENEDTVLRGVPGDIFDLVKLYRILCRWIIKRSTMTPWSQLPPRLRKRISLEQHAVVAFSIGRIIQDYARDPELGADPIDPISR